MVIELAVENYHYQFLIKTKVGHFGVGEKESKERLANTLEWAQSNQLTLGALQTVSGKER